MARRRFGQTPDRVSGLGTYAAVPQRGFGASVGGITTQSFTPALSLSFVGANRIDPRMTLTRSAVGTYFNSAGLIASAAVDIPRFTYEPVTQASLGLLLEENRTNSATWSQDFSQAVWGANVPTDFTVNTAAGIAPDGTNTANLITSVSAASATSRSWVAGGTAATVSAFFKAGTFGAGNTIIGLRNNTTATMLSQVAMNGTNAIGNYKIDNLPNGWVRVSVWASSGITVGNTLAFYWGTTGAVPVGNTWTVWGGQIEDGASAPTSYIPTTNVAVTRSPDYCSLPSAPWARLSEGTIVCEFINFAQSVPGFLFALNDSTPSNRADIRPGQGNAIFSSSGVDTGLTTAAQSSSNNVRRAAIAYSAVQQVAAVYDGGAVVTGAARAPAALSFLWLSNGDAGNYPGNMIIRNVRYYPQRLPDAVLQALTA